MERFQRNPQPAKRYPRITACYRPTARGGSPCSGSVTRSSRKVWLVLGLLLAPLGGCERSSPAPEAGWREETIELVLTSPQETARTLLLTLQAEQRAIHARQRDAVERYRSLLRTIAAREALAERYRQKTKNEEIPIDLILEKLTLNWGAVLADYLEGVYFDQIGVAANPPGAKTAIVTVPAQGSQDRALLRIECVQDADNFWRVLGVRFVPRPFASTPTLPATTQGAIDLHADAGAR